MKEEQIFRSLFRMLRAEEIRLAVESTSLSQARTVQSYKAGKRKISLGNSQLRLTLQPTANSHQSLSKGSLKHLIETKTTCELVSRMWSAKFSPPTTVILPNWKLERLWMAARNLILKDLGYQIPMPTSERCL